MTDDALLDTARAAAARGAAAAADTVAGFLARGDWSVSYKADASPVTEVDVAAERAIREVLTNAFPAAAFFGEETGASEGAAGEGPALRWLVDPIDGTKSFVRGQPFWSTQIALEVDGELVVGVSSAPAFGERLVAVRGSGATLERRTGAHAPRRARAPPTSPRSTTRSCRRATSARSRPIPTAGRATARFSRAPGARAATATSATTTSCASARRIW